MYSIGDTFITHKEIDDAITWIADCSWDDIDDANELTDAEVLRGIARHYDGGWEQFLADGAY